MKKLLIIASLIIFPSLVFAQTFDSNLYFGLQNNSDVEKLQEFLTDQGVYSGPITGNFFSLTLAAVKKFQTQNNISPAAGFVGPLTRTKVNDVLSIQLNASNQQAVVETGTVAPPTTQNPTTNSNQQLIQNLQAQILAFQQQLIQMQQQNQTVQNQQTQIQSQQTQIQQNQQNQISSIQQQITPSTPTPTSMEPILTPLKPAYIKENWQIYFNVAGEEESYQVSRITRLFWNDTNKNWVNASEAGYELGNWMSVAQYDSQLNGWFVTTSDGQRKGSTPKPNWQGGEYVDKWGHLKIGYPSEWQIVSDLTVSSNISGRAKGLTWEVYFNGNLIATIKNTSAEHLGSMGLVSRAQNGKFPLKPETTYTYKIVAKESDREDSIYEGSFKSGTREWMERYSWPIEN